MDLRATLEELRTRALGIIKRVDIDELEPAALVERVTKLRQDFLSRKGELAAALKRLSEATEADRQQLGELVNQIKDEIETALSSITALKSKSNSAAVHIDPTLDPLPFTGFVSSGGGHLNPATLVRYRLEDICERLGLNIIEGPEVESEFYNFDSLNIPPDHPARDSQDTFWLGGSESMTGEQLLLRTHTSSQQVRAMRTFKAPFYGVFPGRVFRNEATDARHENTFDQLEGLIVDKSISVAHLLGIMEAIIDEFFGREMKWRVRHGYFPFVEPGLEMDAACICEGKDSNCRLCKGSGWLEMLGCGLVHPKVLEAGGLDPNEWSGFAFGLCISRLAMLRYNIPDIRLLLGNDWRFMKQFSGLV